MFATEKKQSNSNFNHQHIHLGDLMRLTMVASNLFIRPTFTRIIRIDFDFNWKFRFLFQVFFFTFWVILFRISFHQFENIFFGHFSINFVVFTFFFKQFINY